MVKMNNFTSSRDDMKQLRKKKAVVKKLLFHTVMEHSPQAALCSWCNE